MALCAQLVGDTANQSKYQALGTALKGKLESAFWNEEKQALVHNRVNQAQGNGTVLYAQSDAVTRYANMFAVFFNYLDGKKKQSIKQSVLAVYMDHKRIKVKAGQGKGYLTFKSRRTPKANIGTPEKVADGSWRLWIDSPEERVVQYQW